MKALSLWQPWASLVAERVKWIETRSWAAPKALIGERVAIHAAKRPPEYMTLGAWEVGRLDPDAPRRMWRWFEHEPPVDLPLGAVIATVLLVGCVPIVDDARARNCVDMRVGNLDAGMALRRDADSGIEVITSVTHQRPYGDFRPGRFAWVFHADTVEKFAEPVPERGHQRIWNWAPA